MERPQELDLEVALDPGEGLFVRELAAAHSLSMEVRDDALGILAGDPGVDIAGGSEHDVLAGERNLDGGGAYHDDVVADAFERVGGLAYQRAGR
jgi:hypothetical protein